MKRIEQLINDVRFHTNEDKGSRFSDSRFNKLFNDAQEEVQRIIHTSSQDSRFFVKEELITAVYSQEEYALPLDIYSVNAVNSIARLVQQQSIGYDYYKPLPQVTDKERRKEFGYIIQGSNYLISPVPRSNLFNGIRVNYTAKLPDLSFRFGQIKSIITNTIRLKTGYADQDILDYDDYITVVDKFGVQKEAGLFVDGYDTNTGKITLSAAPSASVLADDYVLIGKNSTTNPQLPDSVEPFLTRFVERSVFYINSSKDIQNSDIFSEREKDDIIMLFSKIDKDTKYPPIVDNTYLNTYGYYEYCKKI